MNDLALEIQFALTIQWIYDSSESKIPTPRASSVTCAANRRSRRVQATRHRRERIFGGRKTLGLPVQESVSPHVRECLSCSSFTHAAECCLLRCSDAPSWILGERCHWDGSRTNNSCHHSIAARFDSEASEFIEREDCQNQCENSPLRRTSVHPSL
jgi:hypothetical protein